MFRSIGIRIVILVVVFLVVSVETNESSANQLYTYYFPIIHNAQESLPTSGHGKRLLVGVTIRDWDNMVACNSVQFDLYHDWRIPNMGTPDLPVCGKRMPFLWCSQYGPELYDTALGAGSSTAYTGIIYFGNEPERASQCNKSPEEIAVNYLEMRAAFPNAQVVGPHVANAEGVEYFKQWWGALVEISGTTNHELDGVGLHLYADMEYNKRVIKEYTEFLDSIGQETVQIHITEFSVMQNDAAKDDPMILIHFLDYLEQNARIHSLYYWANVQACSPNEHGYKYPSTYLVDCDGNETKYLQTIKEWLATDS